MPVFLFALAETVLGTGKSTDKESVLGQDNCLRTDTLFLMSSASGFTRNYFAS